MAVRGRKELHPEEQKLIDSIGFSLEKNKPHFSEKALKARRERGLKRWHLAFQKVLDFIDEHGHLPTWEDKKLYNWLIRMRLRSDALSDEQKKLFADIGWSLKLTGPRFTEKTRMKKKERDMEKWHIRFNQVREFVEKHHRLPRYADDRIMYHWVIGQRVPRVLKNMDLNQKHLLQSIGVSLKPIRYNFDSQVALYKKDPNTRRSKDWERRIQKRYKSGKLTEYQIKKLQKIIDLGRHVEQDTQKSFAAANKKRHAESVERHLPLWIKYKDPNTRPFLTYYERSRANSFKQQMRLLYKKGSLPQDEIELFRKLDILL